MSVPDKQRASIELLLVSVKIRRLKEGNRREMQIVINIQKQRKKAVDAYTFPLHCFICNPTTINRLVIPQSQMQLLEPSGFLLSLSLHIKRNYQLMCWFFFPN